MTNNSSDNEPNRPIRISRTVKEGEPTLIDGLIVEVRRKRRHGGQYRVIVRAASDCEGSGASAGVGMEVDT
ncbi:MAG: hypothetical protein EXS05_23330 [Planctomycetaceae bacterium]|nr:hypothetical protein [Planctomycetaceae bacterium]